MSIAAPAAEELRLLLGQACERIEVAGSIRRGKAAVGDIELVAIPKVETVEKGSMPQLFGPPTPIVERWNMLWMALDPFFGSKEKEPYIKKGDRYRAFRWPVFRAGDEVGKIQVDLFTATPENWGLIYLIRTGSSEFSQRVVTALRTRGYCSSEGQVYRLRGGEPHGDPIPTPTEDDVFKLAGMRFISPTERSF